MKIDKTLLAIALGMALLDRENKEAKQEQAEHDTAARESGDDIEEMRGEP